MAVNYCIRNCLKVKMHFLKNVEAEANRSAEDVREHPERFHTNIDPEKTDSNVWFVRTDDWGRKVAELAEEKGIKLKDDATVVMSSVYAFSPGRNFTDDEAMEYFKACLEYDKAEGGVVINAVVHRDETSWHMQVAKVPLYSEQVYKREPVWEKNPDGSYVMEEVLDRKGEPVLDENDMPKLKRKPKRGKDRVGADGKVYKGRIIYGEKKSPVTEKDENGNDVPVMKWHWSARDLFGGKRALSEMQTDFAEKVGKRFGLERGKCRLEDKKDKVTHKTEAQMRRDLAQQQQADAEVARDAALEAQRKAETARDDAVAKQEKAEKAAQEAQGKKEQLDAEAEQARKDAMVQKYIAKGVRYEVEGIQAEKDSLSSEVTELKHQKTTLSGEVGGLVQQKTQLTSTVEKLEAQAGEKLDEVRLREAYTAINGAVASKQQLTQRLKARDQQVMDCTVSALTETLLRSRTPKDREVGEYIDSWWTDLCVDCDDGMRGGASDVVRARAKGMLSRTFEAVRDGVHTLARKFREARERAKVALEQPEDWRAAYNRRPLVDLPVEQPEQQTGDNQPEASAW